MAKNLFSLKGVVQGVVNLILCNNIKEQYSWSNFPMFTLNCCSNASFIFLFRWFGFVFILFWIKTIVCVLVYKSWVLKFSQVRKLFSKMFRFQQLSAWLFIFLVVYKKMCISMAQFAMFLFRLRRQFSSQAWIRFFL